jgi:Ser/Thr protein kinase RdoA (MazF antagonist)
MALLLSNKGCAAPLSRAALLENQGTITEMWNVLAAGVARHGIGESVLQLVHGDVSPVNLIFDKEDVTLIDWDCLHYGIRAYDALGDVVNRPPMNGVSGAEFRCREAQRVLNGYRRGTSSPLSRRERESIGVFSIARQLEDLRQRMAVLPSLREEQDACYAALIHGRVRMLRQIAAQERLAPEKT